MDDLRKPPWGPQPLPNLLTEQLSAHGFSPSDAPRCAEQIRTCDGAVARSSLFVDLGACKFLEGDIDGAISSWRHAIASGHEASASRALVNLGLLYEHLHLHTQAVGVLAGVIERSIEPHASKAALASARCFWALGDAEQAMETMARLAQATMVRRPDSDMLAETLFGLGEIAEAAGRTDRAERAWRVAVAGPASPAQRAACDRLVPLLLSLENDYELIEVLERQPDQQLETHAPALLDRIEWLARNGRNDQAASLARSVVGESLTNNDRFRLADTRLQVGLVNEAIDEYETLLSSDIGDVRRRAAFSLGEVYRTYNMDDAAISLYGQVVTDGDPFWGAKASVPLGDLLARIDQLDAATELWTSAAASDVAIIRHAAEQRLGAVDQARAAQVIAAKPSAPERITVTKTVAPKTVMPQRVEPAPPAKVEVPVAQVPAEPSEPVVVLLSSLEDDMPEEAPGEQIEEPAFVDPMIDVAAAPDELDQFSNGDFVDPMNDTTDIIGEPQQLGDPDFVDPMNDTTDIIGEPQQLGDPDFVDELNRTDDLVDDDVIDLVEEPFGTQHVPNPYAALAPDAYEADVAPSPRNPYAELAPNYHADEFVPDENVEAGDWESMLDVPERASKASASARRDSPFSRYT